MSATIRLLLPLLLLALDTTTRAQEGTTVRAEVAPWTEVALKSRVDGQVEQLSVGVGDQVTRNQELLRLSAHELTAELARTDAIVERAEQHLRFLEIQQLIADRELAIERRTLKIAAEKLPEAMALCEAAEQTFKQTEKLREKEMVSNADFQRARGRVAQARGQVTTLGEQVKQAEDRVAIADLGLQAKAVAIEEARAKAKELRADRDLARLRVELTRLKCPLEHARVTAISVQPGALVQAQGSTLLRLVDARRVRLKLSIPQELVREMDDMIVQLQGPDGKQLVAPLAEVSGVVKKPGSMAAAVHLDNAEGYWVPGMTLEVLLVRKQ